MRVFEDPCSGADKAMTAEQIEVVAVIHTGMEEGADGPGTLTIYEADGFRSN